MSLVVHLMGTVRLVRNGQPVDVGGPKQQAVLAVLALSAGRRVSTDRLVDLVWDENPPASARRTVQSYIASLRRALGGGAALEPSQNGYALNVDRGQVDLLAFEDQAADLLGDAGLDPDNKAQGLADMLSTWETPLDGLRGTSRLAELTAPFEELRFQAVEGLTAAQIAGTRAGDAVKMLPAYRAVLADACARGGDLRRAEALLDADRAGGLAMREDLQWTIAHAAWTVAAVLVGDTATAERWFEEAMAIHDGMESPLLVAYTDAAWSALLADRDLGDDRQRARAMAERAVTVATAGGYGDIQSDAQTVLARLP